MTPAAESRAPFWLWAALPVAVAAWLRVRGHGDLDPFTDEGANILTALDPRVRTAFEPLEQGRPWLVYLFRPAGWFPAEALAVARLMSASAGLLTMGALGWTLHRLGGHRAALAGLWLWAVLPFAVWHERLALQDPFVTALLAGSLALLVAGLPAGRRWAWLGAGGLFGVALLLKISAVLALPWLGLVYVAHQRLQARPVFDRQLWLIPLGALLPVLTLGGDLARLGSKLGRYDALPSVAHGGFLQSALERLAIWLGFYSGYGGWPLLLLLAGALVLAARGRQWLALACAAAWAVSLLVAALCYNNTYARYALPDHLPLILGLGLAWGAIPAAAPRWRDSATLLFAVALVRWGAVSWGIGTDPRTAAVPAAEIKQYATGPWSGRGLAETRRFLADYADQHQVRCLVLTHRFMRPGCYGLLLAELGDPRIGVVPFTVYEPAELAVAGGGLRHVSAGTPVACFLLYEGSLYPAHPWLAAPGSPARLVRTIDRGAGESFSLWQFQP
jgi:hypothetical protein